MSANEAESATGVTEPFGEREPAIPIGEWVAWATGLEVRAIRVEARYERPIRAQDPLNVVARGLLGERLRDLRCLTRAPSCEGCTRWSACDYGLVFEDASGVSEGGRDGSGAPRPFWLQGIPAVQEIAGGSVISARLCAVGPAVTALPYLDVALRSALERLGAPPGSAAGARLSASRVETVAFGPGPATGDVRLRTTTPLVLRGNWETARAACPQAPWLALLLRGAVRRLDQLATTFGPGDRRPFAQFPALGEVEVVSGGLSTWSRSRFSHKQHQRIRLEGLEGEVVVRGPGLAEAAPLLGAAALVGIGKLTSMGFGELAVSSANASMPVR